MPTRRLTATMLLLLLLLLSASSSAGGGPAAAGPSGAGAGGPATTAAGATGLPQCGGVHKFMAASWANTCECADPQMVPQSNGSFCLTEPVCTRIHEPCSKQCPSCNLSVAANTQCATFDNIFEMERMIAPNIPQNADGHWFGTCTSRPLAAMTSY